jgi:hypothetical protein
MSYVQGAFVSLIMYGSKEGHTLFRNDGVSLQFKTTLTNVSEDNYVAKNDDGEWCFYMNSLHKVKPGGKNYRLHKQDEIHIINVSKNNPLLGDFLDGYEPVCREIFGWGDGASAADRKKAYLLFEYQKKDKWTKAPINPVTYSQRANRLYEIATKKGRILEGALDPELAHLAGGTDKARHAAIGQSAGKTLSREEIDQRAHGMCHSAGRQDTGTRVYAQDLTTDSQPSGDERMAAGTEVRVHSLERTPELNDTFGTVVEYLPDKRRYRVKLAESGEMGLFRKESLEDLSAIVDELEHALCTQASKQTQEQPLGAATTHTLGGST